MIRAHVIVRPRASIFDPQGDAVRRAIQTQGLSTIKQVHVGKYIELELESSPGTTSRAQLETICRDLLSNPVIEDFELNLSSSEEKKTTSVKKSSSPPKKVAVKLKKSPTKPAPKAVIRFMTKKTPTKKTVAKAVKPAAKSPAPKAKAVVAKKAVKPVAKKAAAPAKKAVVKKAAPAKKVAAKKAPAPKKA